MIENSKKCKVQHLLIDSVENTRHGGHVGRTQRLEVLDDALEVSVEKPDARAEHVEEVLQSET